MLNLIMSLLLAYIIGSIPIGFIFGKVLKKIDIREHGSGNVGATNIFRVVGKVPGIIVLIIDMLKGAVCVAFLPEIFFNNTIGIIFGPELYKILIGIAVISGHVWTIFLKFKGGKGVATTAGVLVILTPKALAGSAIVWGAVFAAFKIVSIASIAASILLPVFSVIFYRSIYLVLFTVLLSIVGTYKHKSNIKRLLRGEEKRLI
ncbi:MAG: glycerol-3-phosphate 1-O-acyltransferase PlsY [Candidatus Omnitrophica bacterium]|nr:glycerol-3-phosphate 1-O-acyltransferase PlsY [Candidatus Omnitrophota bacterium]